MRIAFEASNVISKKPTGVAVYIKNFIESIATLNSENDLKLFYKADRIKHKQNWYRPTNIEVKTYLGSIFPPFKNTDIIHGLDTYVPNWKKCKRIVTFHDILPLLFTDTSITPRDFRLKKEKDYRKAIEIADLIITVSENTKSDLIDYFQIPETKVTSVYPGLDTGFFYKQSEKQIDDVRKKYGLSKNYLLFVGTISGRKNTAGLVEAFAKSKARDPFELVLAGSISYMGENTIKAIEKNNLGDKVKILGYIENKDLPKLYSGASGFLFPTFYEGFGFPILEAMLCGTKVLASNVGSAPEIGKDFAIYVDPQNIESIAFGIDRLIADSEINLIEARNHALLFTWEATAKKTMKIYESIL